MTRARMQIIALETTPYYHTISRCVRRAFLCDEDSLTGKSYEHRKVWVINRLCELSDVFAIDVCAYAVMSNHYHLVLRVDKARAENWSEAQVMERWEKLFNLPLLIRGYQKDRSGTEAEALEAQVIIATWRERLMDISWFMRSLNEYLARQANAEDQCKGRFWEGRFKSQALLDEAAVLTCMSYVDLNPVRARMAETPEESDFTSIQQRIAQLGEDKRRQNHTSRSVPLMPLVKQSKDPHRNAIGFTLHDYLELIDWAGRAVRKRKRGVIKASVPSILQRLRLEPSRFLEHIKGEAQTERPTVLGPVQRIRQVAGDLGRRFLRGTGEGRKLYLSASVV